MKRPNQLGGRIWLVCVGFTLMAMGALFVSYLWGAYQRAARMDAWVETPCRIDSVAVDDDLVTQHYAPKFRLDIRYRYEFEGAAYESTRYKRLPTKSASEKKIAGIAERYPAGSETVCFVDPADPAMAVLRKDSKGALYSIWFPGLFVAGGLGMVVSAFLPRRRS